MKEAREKEQECERTQGLRELKWEWDPHIQGNQLGQKESMWDCQRVNSWPVSIWMKWEPHRQSMSQPYVLWTGIRVHGNLGRWELEHGDWGTKSEREIKEPIPFIIATKRIKYLGTNLPKETKELYTENYKTLMKEIKWHKQMGRFPMFLDRRNQYCETDYTTKCNLQIQWNLYQVTNCIFHWTRTKIFTNHMVTQKTSNS